MTDISKSNNDNKSRFYLINYIFGFTFFVGSFVLIFWHEGNMNHNISIYAARSSNAILVKPDKTYVSDASSITDLTDNNILPLHFLSGELSSSTPIGMDVLLDGKYAAIRRITEMYSWKIGETTSSHITEWTEYPNENIKDSEHKNPRKSVSSKTLISSSLNIKDIEISRRNLKIDDEKIWTTVKTDSDKYMVGTAKNFPNDGTYFYQNNKDNPAIGDIRIKYQIIPTGKAVTIFGIMDDNILIKHTGELGSQLFTFFESDKSAAVKSLRPDTFVYTLWGIRFLSVIMMILGIKMMIPSMASAIKNHFFENQEIVHPKLFHLLTTTIIIATTAIMSASLRHNVIDLIALGLLLIILTLTILIILNKIAYNKAHENTPTFEIIKKHKESEDKIDAKTKTKKEPPKPIDMLSKEELGIDDMSITLSSGKVVDEHGHGILPTDMPQAIARKSVSISHVSEESSKPIELTLGEAIKPTPKKSTTPPPLSVNETIKPKSLIDSDET